MRFLVPAVVVTAVLSLCAPALAGGSLKAPDCDGQYVPNPLSTPAEVRAAVLCVVNAARKAQGLPAFARSAQLEKAAQGHASDEARKGYANHNGRGGSTMASRIRGAGYRFSAYNEALGLEDEGASAYDLVRGLVAGKAHPCSAVFDPRFRDIGVGFKVGKAPGAPLFKTTYLVIDFGLKSGKKPASSKTRPASSCPHKLPAPPFTGSPVVPGGAPQSGADTVTQTLRCTAKVTCKLTATLRLVSTGGTSTPVEVTIPARGSKAVVFPFTKEALDAELASKEPRAKLVLDLAEPAAFKDEFSGPLAPRSSR